VDLAYPPGKLAIEVDGKSHLTRKWKFLDARKTSVLECLGWKVLRFWNKEINNSPERVVAEIQTCIT
jgi:very-short-patch-repair endonuclease